MNDYYSIDYYCVNLMGNVSTVATYRYFPTPPNQSIVTKLTLNFNTSLTSAQ